MALENRIAQREQADDVQGMVDEENMGGDITPEDMQEYLDGLPPEQKEFLAYHMTPEFAQAVGIATGSQVAADVFGQMANPEIALIPVPRSMAQELMQQISGQAPSGQPPEGQPAPDAPQQMAGPMSPPM